VQIISLSAPQPKCGKDTLYELFKQRHTDLNVYRLAFGDYLKKEVAEMLYASRYVYLPVDYIIEEMNDQSLKDKPMAALSLDCLIDCEFKRWALQHHAKYAPRSLRWYLQYYATDYMRKFKGEEFYWIGKVMDTIKTMPSDSYVFITDTRSINEAETLRNNRALMLKVVPDWELPVIVKHGSDTALDNYKFDSVIINRKDDKLSMVYELEALLGGTFLINPHYSKKTHNNRSNKLYG